MQTIKTSKGITTVSRSDAPKFICTGICQKVFWENEVAISNIAIEVTKCPNCNGNLKVASTKDYEVIESNNEKLSLWDNI